MKTEKEKMLAGESYLATDPQLIRERQYAKRLIVKFNNCEDLTSPHARETLRLLIPNAPSSLYIETPFHCDYGYNIHCGENVYFNANCVILDPMKVHIGSNVLFGPHVQLYTASHPLDAEMRRTTEYARSIHIGNDCWIGGGAIICPGVSIGDRCVIGAGAVVTRNVPDHAVFAGNPARLIRMLNKQENSGDR